MLHHLGRPILTPALLFYVALCFSFCWSLAHAQDGWTKYTSNPVFTGLPTNVYTDVAVVNETGSLMRMLFSWQNLGSIGYTDGMDGVYWGKVSIAFTLQQANSWASIRVYSPCVVLVGETYHMWFGGDISGGRGSGIGYTRCYLCKGSGSIIYWDKSNTSILSPAQQWESTHVSYPSVIFDARDNLFKMWYSGGLGFTGVGYASSKDGVTWEKYSGNPIFPTPSLPIAETTVVQINDYFVMFYSVSSSIGIARSKDGILWENHPQNPIITSSSTDMEARGIRKPRAVFISNTNTWYLWYVGLNSNDESQIGLATHYGYDLGFPT